MKRETLRRLKRVVAGNGIIERADAADALATDAEVKRLRKTLRHIHDNTECLMSHEWARAALKPQVTRERKRR